VAGLALGGEYFLAPRFSVGVEAQLNGAFPAEESSRFGMRGSRTINTATAVNATFYF
jgi:hypothetical protein